MRLCSRRWTDHSDTLLIEDLHSSSDLLDWKPQQNSNYIFRAMTFSVCVTEFNLGSGRANLCDAANVGFFQGLFWFN